MSQVTNTNYKQEEFVEMKNNSLEEGLKSFLNIMDMMEMLSIGVFFFLFQSYGLWLRKHITGGCKECFKSWNDGKWTTGTNKWK